MSEPESFHADAAAGDTSALTGRQQARALDGADPLRRFADRFLPMDDDVIAYLDGNSLGRPPATVAAAWSELAERTWPGRLIRGWTEGWLDLPGVVGDELGAACLGVAAGQTVIADSTTVNFYKCLRAALNLRPGRRRVVLDRDNFPTNRFVAQSLARDLDLELVWLEAAGAGGDAGDAGDAGSGVRGGAAGGVDVEQLARVLDDRTAVVTLSHTAYRSAHVADLDAITDLAHRSGALVLWDLSHSVGVFPLRLDAAGVDFAVGCTYKFLCAGPGAPAFAYVAAAHQEKLDQPIWGWLGREDAFEMGQDYLPAPGITSMISGTPSVPGILAVREGVRLIAEAGVQAIRAKAVALGEFAIDRYDELLQPLGFGLASPRAAELRGGHVSVTRSDARALAEALAEAGVIPDFRTPDIIRLGLSPLTTSYTQVHDALSVLRRLAGPADTAG